MSLARFEYPSVNKNLYLKGMLVLTHHTRLYRFQLLVLFPPKCFELRFFGRVLNIFLLEKVSFKNCEVTLFYKNVRQHCKTKLSFKNHKGKFFY